MGEVFAGRYELVDPIGRGGVGAVWRAWDHRRRRYVAAKVLLQSDAHSLLRFVREQALRIDHPHVLAPTSWAADDDKVLFTMDLVAGGSLVHLVGDYGPLPPAFVCTLLDQLLAGLAAVHAEHVVHRDVKPANVLLEATGTGRPRLRLSDFGIAMRLGEPRLTETNLVVGTPGYLAPEQLMGAEPDFPADLFAVGLVALYLLEGAKPDSKALIQYFAEHGTPGAPKGIPEPLWQVVAMLLQPDPEARFRTATGARKALAAAAELLPEPGPDDELIEIFDQLGPLPKGFAPEGPLERARGLGPREAPPSLDGASRDERPAPTGTGSRQRAEATGDRTGSALGAAAAGSDPRRSTDHSEPPSSPSAPAQPISMSDTGSFHLPPPQATVTSSPAPGQPHQAQAQGQAPYQQSPVSPYDLTHPLPPVSQPLPPAYPSLPLPPAEQERYRADTSTASYTAQSPQTPPARQKPSRHRARRPSRPGPPAKVAIPVLLLALVCYAVGFWALTRI
ncbi:protein kinase [Streptomyces sp. NPDC006624]|uniref:serine/threonine-protein kinase n=1 Tax=Streptomyces sp. NPDC006624 TaxID=3154892 RepID=UPI0033B169B2